MLLPAEGGADVIRAEPFKMAVSAKVLLVSVSVVARATSVSVELGTVTVAAPAAALKVLPLILIAFPPAVSMVLFANTSPVFAPTTKSAAPLLLIILKRWAVESPYRMSLLARPLGAAFSASTTAPLGFVMVVFRIENPFMFSGPLRDCMALAAGFETI